MTNQTKHTPGPWYCGSESEWGDEIIIDNDGLRVASTMGEKGHRRADAKLIATAPELLAMLRDCESYAHAMGKVLGSGEGAKLAARCRELIAKAEGQKKHCLAKSHGCPSECPSKTLGDPDQCSLKSCKEQGGV